MDLVDRYKLVYDRQNARLVVKEILSMNKSDLVKGLALKVNLPVPRVEEVVNAFLDVIGLSLACGEDVQLSGFGKFEVRERRAVTRRNPRTGDSIDVPAKTSMGFKPSPHLKERLNVSE